MMCMQIETFYVSVIAPIATMVINGIFISIMFIYIFITPCIQAVLSVFADFSTYVNFSLFSSNPFIHQLGLFFLFFYFFL